MSLTLEQLLVKTFPPQPYFIGEGLLRRGSLMVIGGQPKSYKSFVLNSMIYHLVNGGALFNVVSRRHGAIQSRFDCPGAAKVLFIEQEIGEEDLKERLGNFVSGISEPQRTHFLRSVHVESGNHRLQLDTPDGLREITQLIDSVRPDVVCLDPFVEFHTSDENDALSITRVLRRLDDLRERFKFTTIMTHHHRKPASDAVGSTRGGDMLRGSSTLFGKVDTVLSLSLINRSAGIIKVESEVRRGRPIREYLIQLNPESKRFEFKKWFTAKAAAKASREKGSWKEEDEDEEE